MISAYCFVLLISANGPLWLSTHLPSSACWDITPVPLRHIHAQTAALELQKLFGPDGKKIAWDDSVNTIFLLGNMEHYARAKAIQILENLDEKPYSGMCVVKMKHADAATCAKQLEVMYRGRNLRVEPRDKVNALILTGSEHAVNAARGTLILWDTTTNGKR